MNKILIFLLFAPFSIFSQELFSDTSNNVDSLGFVNKESSPNYIGVNVAPLVSGVINTKNNYNIKLSALYKRNFGYKNLRISLNHLTEGSISSYDYNIPIKSNDTSIWFRYFNDNYTYSDFRIGFEELRGYSETRVHIGIDAIIGYGSRSSNYFHNILSIDSSSFYSAINNSNDILANATGTRTNNYLVTGIDISFGLDWVMNEVFMMTFQITPQFNYFIFLNEKMKIDPYSEYVTSTDYADFKLGYFDINLIYRF
tara:strand:- start:3345 stop:4112 length:768 start_codon:yes stop_codon:yes gene_type:complete